MYQGITVVDGVSHAANWSLENCASSFGRWMYDHAWQWHKSLNPAGVSVPQQVFLTDMPAEVLARTLFLESDIDVCAHHHLPLYSYFKDGHVSIQKNIELAERWPHRFVFYAGVDSTAPVADSIRSLEEQVAAIPSIVGLKLYPVQVEPLRWGRLDEERLFPLFEKVRELGLKSIAVHKAVAQGPVPMNPFRIDDIEGAAHVFGDINFEIVHAGSAFVPETASALARFPNVYANLESTCLLLYKRPRLFSQILGELIAWGGIEKLFFSASVPIGHPQHLIEELARLELPESVLEWEGIPQLTEQDRAALLGGNYARMAGIDIAARLRAIADDEFTAIRKNDGLSPAWSAWTASAGSGSAMRLESEPA